MQKKLFAACLVIAAFAVVSSLASANPILTEPTGTAIAAGAKITATNVGSVIWSNSVDPWNCSTASLTLTLTSNATATGVKGEITSAKFGGTGATQSGAPEPECTEGNFFLPNTSLTPEINMPWCLEAPAAMDTFTIAGGPCGAPRAIKINFDATGIGTCEYSRSAAVNGTIATDGAGSNENTLAITAVPWTKIGGPGLCPGTVELTMRFSLETDPPASGQIFISS